MEIIHEIKGVQVTQFPTVAAALLAGLGKGYAKKSSRLVSELLLLLTNDRPKQLGEELHAELDWRAEQLNYPLLQRGEAPEPYERTLALVAVEQELVVSDFYKALAEKKYHPADLNESMSYLSLTSRMVDIEVVFCLGKRFLDNTLQERRLLTRKSGGVIEFPLYYPHVTKLKRFYNVVAVREEETH